MRGRRGDTPPATVVALGKGDSGRLRAVLLMSGMPWDELDDGVQQVRLKLLEERARKGDGDGGIRDEQAWSAVVASRVAMDWHRERRRETGLRERLAARWSYRPPVEHPQEHRTLALEVADGLARLTANQRQALVLRYYGDLPVKDIARLLDLPEGTVKSRLHKATAALRNVLGPDREEESA
ncbi:sigma-70 family RNA polymerase sigma factor [Streptomyces sp. NPDC000594]|uniref:RNA polymerase sigma factor n=1 Tax=Streptomyces sp. NPDC000594 TaxID=3154261 RepID=UPI00332DE19F